jgi:hypothetical protein
MRMERALRLVAMNEMPDVMTHEGRSDEVFRRIG